MEKVVKLSIWQATSHHYEVKLLEIRAEDRAEPLAENISGFLSAARLDNKSLSNPGFSIEQHYRGWQERYEGLDGYFKGDPTQAKGFPGEPEVQDCDVNAKELKLWLNEWLQDPEFRQVADILRMELNKEDDIRFLIYADSNILRNLPWGEWDFFEHYDKAEVSLTHSEYLGHDRPVAGKPKKKTGILAICGDEAGIYKYNKENLKRLRSVGAEPEFLNEPGSKQVRDRLWDRNLDILFFAGSGGDRNYINDRDNTKLSHLDNALKTAAENGLKLAIFNCADGLELAELMIRKHQIPVVIAMKEPVPNEFAQEFFEYFLLEYACHKQSLYVAFRKARKRVSDDWQGRLPGIQWLPTIWQNPTKRPPLWQDLLPAVSFQQVSLAGLACTGLVMLTRFAGLLQPLELAAFDQMIRWRPAAKPDDRLLVVEVTEEDIEELKQYPLKGATIIDLLRALGKYKPLAIGLDLPLNSSVKSDKKDLDEYLQKSNLPIVYCNVGPTKSVGSDSPPPPGMSEKQIGFRDIVVDSDGAVRRHLFYMSANSSISCPTSYALSTKLALYYLEDHDLPFEETSTGWRLGKATFQPLKNRSGFYKRLNDDRGQQLLLNYRNFGKVADTVSLTEVLSDEPIRQNKIEDKIVLVGVTAKTGGDIFFANPYGAGRDQQMPRVLVQAQMTSQIISAAEGDRPLLWFAPWWADWFLVAACSVAGGLIVVVYRKLLFQRAAATVALVALSGVCFAFLVTWGVCLPLVPSALALVGTGAMALLYESNPSAVDRWLPKGLKFPAIKRQGGSISLKLPS